MGKPFLSVITPVYNIKDYIGATLDSILSQDFQDFEVVVIDDGSKDNSGAICDEYAKKDKRIKVFHKENGGLAEARNDGIKQSVGKYCWIVEGSDLLPTKNTFSKIFNLLEEREVDILFGRLQDQVEGEKAPKSEQTLYNKEGYYENGEDVLCDLLVNNEWLAISSPVNKVYRLDFIKDNELWFYKGIYHDDDEWLPKAISMAKTCYFTNDIIYSALDWAGCLGKRRNEAALTKKACDKMFIANRCTQEFVGRTDNKKLLSAVCDYYIRMYNDGLLAYSQIQDKELKKKILISAKENKGVYKHAKYTKSKKLKLGSNLIKFMGVKAFAKFINKR